MSDQLHPYLVAGLNIETVHEQLVNSGQLDLRQAQLVMCAQLLVLACNPNEDVPEIVRNQLIAGAATHAVRFQHGAMTQHETAKFAAALESWDGTVPEVPDEPEERSED